MRVFEQRNCLWTALGSLVLLPLCTFALKSAFGLVAGSLSFLFFFASWIFLKLRGEKGESKGVVTRIISIGLAIGGYISITALVLTYIDIVFLFPVLIRSMTAFLLALGLGVLGLKAAFVTSEKEPSAIYYVVALLLLDIGGDFLTERGRLNRHNLPITVPDIFLAGSCYFLYRFGRKPKDKPSIP
jgi:hypothetical protein